MKVIETGRVFVFLLFHYPPLRYTTKVTTLGEKRENRKGGKKKIHLYLKIILKHILLQLNVSMSAKKIYLSSRCLLPELRCLGDLFSRQALAPGEFLTWII